MDDLSSWPKRFSEVQAAGSFLNFASSKGWDVFHAESGACPYDFVIDDGENLSRIEVKMASAYNSKVNVRTRWDCKLAHLTGFDFLFVDTRAGAQFYIPQIAIPATLPMRHRMKYGNRQDATLALFLHGQFEPYIVRKPYATTN